MEKETQQLIKDPSFINWVLQRNGRDEAHWEQYLRQHPELQEHIEEARLMVLGLPFRERKTPEATLNRSWSRLRTAIETVEKREKRRRASRLFRRAAAILVPLILASGILLWEYYGTEKLTEYTTDYGERLEVSLPDGSRVNLNANSTLRVHNLTQTGALKVELWGEAFFIVPRHEPESPLRIRTQNSVITVTGTNFNLHAYQTYAIVSLVDGKIRLARKGEGYRDLEAGQTAWFDREKQKFVIEAKNLAKWTSWVEGKWDFSRGGTLAEAAQRLKATYGLNCKFRPPELANDSIGGVINLKSREIALKGLAIISDLEYQYEGRDTVVFTKLSN